MVGLEKHRGVREKKMLILSYTSCPEINNFTDYLLFTYYGKSNKEKVKYKCIRCNLGNKYSKITTGFIRLGKCFGCLLQI